MQKGKPQIDATTEDDGGYLIDESSLLFEEEDSTSRVVSLEYTNELNGWFLKHCVHCAMAIRRLALYLCVQKQFVRCLKLPW